MTNLTAITAKFTPKQIKYIDALVQSEKYTNRSEALRAIVNALMPKGIARRK